MTSIGQLSSDSAKARERIAAQRRLAAGIPDRRQRDHMLGMIDRFDRNTRAIDGQREETRGGNVVIRVVESREQIGGGAMTPTTTPPQSRTETFGSLRMIITTAIG